MENNNELLEQRIEDLLCNEELLEKLLFAESPAALAAILEENKMALQGVSIEEAFEAFRRARDGELEETDLDNVAGGATGVYFMLKVGKYFTIAMSGASAGTVLTVLGGAAVIGLATYAAYRIIKKATK